MWLEIAEQQYLDLHDDTRALADRYLARLEQDPNSLPGSVYDPTSDQWTLALGDRLLLYAVVPDPPTVIVLRLLLVFP